MALVAVGGSPRAPRATCPTARPHAGLGSRAPRAFAKRGPTGWSPRPRFFFRLWVRPPFRSHLFPAEVTAPQLAATKLIMSKHVVSFFFVQNVFYCKTVDAVGTGAYLSSCLILKKNKKRVLCTVQGVYCVQ